MTFELSLHFLILKTCFFCYNVKVGDVIEIVVIIAFCYTFSFNLWWHGGCGHSAAFIALHNHGQHMITGTADTQGSSTMSTIHQVSVHVQQYKCIMEDL